MLLHHALHPHTTGRSPPSPAATRRRRGRACRRHERRGGAVGSASVGATMGKGEPTRPQAAVRAVATDGDVPVDATTGAAAVASLGAVPLPMARWRPPPQRGSQAVRRSHGAGAHRRRCDGNQVGRPPPLCRALPPPSPPPLLLPPPPRQPAVGAAATLTTLAAAAYRGNDG